MISKRPILKLNANYQPLEPASWSDIMVGIFSKAFVPLDISYTQNEDGSYDTTQIESFIAIKDWKQWIKLPIRPCDDYVQTSKGPVRLPSIVICSRFDRMIIKKGKFPTKQNIFRRDNYTCAYTGKKLQKSELSVDHIIPSSRGGTNTWDNLVCCDREVNNAKADRTPSECGLKLLWKPTKPKDGVVFDTLRDDWQMFVK
jgi:5-methylcytosine-specific restriction endonuclease McrA